MQETWVQSLDWEDPLEKEMATHSSFLAWRIPWTEEPGGLQSLGSQRVRHNWVMRLDHSVSHLVVFWIWHLPSCLEHSTSCLTSSSSGVPRPAIVRMTVWWTFTTPLRSFGDPYCVSARRLEWPPCCVTINHPHLCSPICSFDLEAVTVLQTLYSH